MRADFIEAAMLEIYRYVPPALLPEKGVGNIPLEEFLRLLARARYIEGVEQYIVAKAIERTLAP